ncbi:hypothetical protein HG537_0A08850 [Torulaspora globosa]|uniref:PIG-U-domain-containing protein n=1 Tax=Torulaspora globosa TaxID=48254 RepID=A0A7H9HPT2_9SACH|nr:hypothetical protein HG537_0A08850 [Torulaspora sp. CBS 2947]
MWVREKWVLFACVVARLLVSLLFPSLQQQLDKSVEFSTPFTSYRSLREGVYMLENGFQVYNGGVVHQAPLLVAVMSFIESDTVIALVYALLDAVVAYQLTCIAQCFAAFVEIPVWLPSLLYSFNPLVLLSCVSRSSVIFTNVCISTAVLSALQGEIVVASMAIATAGYLSLYPMLLLIPLLSLFEGKTVKVKAVTCSSVTLVSLLALSNVVCYGSWGFLEATYGALVRFDKLFPNLGLWWYFFIEMFEAFLPFFKAVFNIMVVSFIGPITLRFYKQPFYAFVLFLGWILITKPYPTLGDAGFFLSFIPFFKPLYGYLRYSLLSCLLFLHAVLLSPIFYHLWVDLGSGNSNFFYAITLVYALALASIVVDLCWAMLRMDYDQGKPNYSLKITQI